MDSNSKPEFYSLQREKKGGGPVTQNETYFFNNLINYAHLLDLGFVGYPFTWYNKIKCRDFIEA